MIRKVFLTLHDEQKKQFYLVEGGYTKHYARGWSMLESDSVSHKNWCVAKCKAENMREILQDALSKRLAGLQTYYQGGTLVNPIPFPGVPVAVISEQLKSQTSWFKLCEILEHKVPSSNAAKTFLWE